MRHGFKKSDYDALKIGLKRERQELYRRINERVDDMLQAGWVDEVKGLIEMGYDIKTRPFSGIGYKEIVAYLNGAMAYEDMVKDIKRQTRRYAKRQLTWFSKENVIYWYEYPEARGAIIERVKGFIGHGGQ
jgi:tRNA dimethylallyltransferase